VSRGKRGVNQSLFCEPKGLKDRQTFKIRELADTLVSVGFVSLDEQAAALGLSRSTTWTILAGKHKNYGLSAALLRRILDKRDLNSRIRTKILEYVREKTSGSYGHNSNQLRRFARQFAESRTASPHDTLFTDLTNGRNALTLRVARKRSAMA
jgi:hypothetical protein